VLSKQRTTVTKRQTQRFFFADVTMATGREGPETLEKKEQQVRIHRTGLATSPVAGTVQSDEASGRETGQPAANKHPNRTEFKGNRGERIIPIIPHSIAAFPSADTEAAERMQTKILQSRRASIAGRAG
jgi:hypothetical protein